MSKKKTSHLCELNVPYLPLLPTICASVSLWKNSFGLCTISGSFFACRCIGVANILYKWIISDSRELLRSSLLVCIQHQDSYLVKSLFGSVCFYSVAMLLSLQCYCSPLVCRPLFACHSLYFIRIRNTGSCNRSLDYLLHTEYIV